MTQVYKGHLVYYRQEPFVYMADADVMAVRQFINDYCIQNRVPMVPDEWFIGELNTIISRDTLAQANRVTGGAFADTSPSGASKYDAIPGRVAVKINPKCFEG